MSQTDFNFGYNDKDNNVETLPWNIIKKHLSKPVPNVNFNLDKYFWMHDSICDCNECLHISFIADHIRKQIWLMTREVRKASQPMAPSAAELLRKSANGGDGNLLHGSDVPKKQGVKPFAVKLLGFREAPEGFQGSLGIVDIEEIFGCTAWSLNKTNFKAVAQKMGDNTDKWKGALRLQVIQVRNPKSGKFGPSLAVAE